MDSPNKGNWFQEKMGYFAREISVPLHRDFEVLISLQEQPLLTSMRVRQVSAITASVLSFGLPAGLYMLSNPESAMNFMIIAAPVLVATFQAWFMVSYEKVQTRFLDFANRLSGQMLEAFIGSCTVLFFGIVAQVGISSFPELLSSMQQFSQMPLFNKIIGGWLIIGSARFIYQVIMSALRYDLLDATNQGAAPLAKRAYAAMASTIRDNEVLLNHNNSLANSNIIVVDLFYSILQEFERLGLIPENMIEQIVELKKSCLEFIHSPIKSDIPDSENQYRVDRLVTNSTRLCMVCLKRNSLFNSEQEAKGIALIDGLKEGIAREEADTRVRLIIGFLRHILESVE